MPIYGSKFQIVFIKTFDKLFDVSQNLKKLALNNIANGQLVTYVVQQRQEECLLLHEQMINMPPWRGRAAQE